MVGASKKESILSRIPDVNKERLEVLGLGITLGSVGSVLWAMWFVWTQRYVHYRMHGLIVQTFQSVLNGGVILGIALALTGMAGKWFRNRHRVLAHSLATMATSVLFFYGGWVINRHWLPQFWSWPSLLGNALVGVAAAILWLFLSGLAFQWLAARLQPRWIPMGATLVGVLLLLNGYSLSQEFVLGGRGPNVILIGVDTLRPDHLGTYGYDRNTSPNLDQWVQGATLFENCVTAIPRTTQSLASIMTSKYPHQHGVRDLNDPLPDRELTLAEILKNEYYKTISTTATGIIYGKLNQGFEVIRETKREYAAGDIVDYALGELSRAAGKYFLFIFIRDPHMDYKPPELVFDRQYRGPMRGNITYHPNKEQCVLRNDFDDRLRQHAVAAYDSEIVYTDQQIGRLLEAIERKSKNNIILFFADHGESLGEHGYFYDHGHMLYQPGLGIPFIAKGIDFGRKRISSLVRSIDFVPTILGQLDIHVARGEFQGVDLRVKHEHLEAFGESGRALINAPDGPLRREVKGIRGRLRSLILDDKKLIYVPTHSGGRFEFYDLQKDPRELVNRMDEVDAADMKRKLFSWMEGDRNYSSLEESDFSEEEKARLRNLGYL